MKFCTLAIAGAFGPGCISRKSSSLGAWSTRTMLITGRVSGVVFTTAPACATGGSRKKTGIAAESRRAARREDDKFRTQLPHFAPRLGTLDARLCGMLSTETNSLERPAGSPAAVSGGSAEFFSFASSRAGGTNGPSEPHLPWPSPGGGRELPACGNKKFLADDRAGGRATCAAILAGRG